MKRSDGLDIRLAHRGAFALVELLVVIGILCLIAAILLPAVQASREAARRLRCCNNLKQIALSLHAYHDQEGRLPRTIGFPNPGARQKQFSFFAAILPYLEYQPLYHSINFMTELRDPYTPGGLTESMLANVTVMGTSVELLFCPSDRSQDRGGPTAGTNYRANTGSDRWSSPRLDGIRTGPFDTNYASITDGLSNTVLIAEKLRGTTESSRLDPRTAMILGGLGEPYSADDSLRACESMRGTPHGFRSASGLCWLVGSLSQTLYNHVLEPNGRIPDCVAPADPIFGIVSARSRHGGLLNAAMVDGSVRLIKSSISRATWRALGTRAAGEVIDSSDQ